jgi:tetratricopeptide (TPR) repeat protein
MTLGRLSQDDKATPDAQRDVAIDKIRIGDVFSRQNELDKALQEYQPASEIYERLVLAYSKEPTYQSNLSRVNNHVASVYERQGDLPKANGLYQKSLELRRNLARRDPSNNAWLDAVGAQYSKIGDLSVRMKNDTSAINSYKSAKVVWDILVVRLPDKVDWMLNSAEVLRKLISLILLQPKEITNAQKDDVINYAQSALNLRLDIAQRSSDSLRQRELAAAYIQLGDVFKATDDDMEAFKQYQKARFIIDEFTTAHPADGIVQSLDQLRHELCSKDAEVCR